MATEIQITTGDASILVELSDGSTVLVDPNTEKTIELADDVTAKVAVRSDEEPDEDLLDEKKGGYIDPPTEAAEPAAPAA